MSDQDSGVTGTPAGNAPVAPDPAITISPASFGAVFVGDHAPRFAVSVDADTLDWTVRDLWGALVRSGSEHVDNGRAELVAEVGEGYYTLELVASRDGAPVAQGGSSFAVLAAFDLPADSPFGANTHLPPLELLPLMVALGITWARTDLTWTEIEPPPLAGWTAEVHQADAVVEGDQTVARSGRASVKIVNRSPRKDNVFATIAQQVTVRPDTTYTFSAWVKGENVKALQFTVRPDWGARVDAPSGTFDWTHVTFQYTTGTESTLSFRLLSNDVTDAAWLDDASVTMAGSDTNLLTNPGFEKGWDEGYTFDTYTPFYEALEQNRIHPLSILDYANPKYDEGHTPYTDAGRQAFAAYSAAVMKRFRGQITAVEVYNEPNGWWFTSGPASADPTYYAALLASTYAAVKAVDPSVTVIGGVTAGTVLDWVRRMFEAGAMAHLDALSNHPYTGAPESGTPTDEDERQVIALIKEYNNGNAKPVWATELGWTLADELTTAGFAVRGLVLALAGGVAKFFWYDLVGDQRYGLLNEVGTAYTPRPVFVSYAVAIRLLTGRELTTVGDLASAGIRSYVFTGSGRDDVAVLWSTDPHKAVTVAIDRPFDLIDMAGSRTSLTPLDGDVALTLTGTPVYLQAPRLSGRPLVTAGALFDMTAQDLVHKSDETVTLQYVLNNSQGTQAVDAVFTSLGISTSVRAAAGRRVLASAAVPVGSLAVGRNIIVTAVTVHGHQVARLVSVIAVVDVPEGEVASVGVVDWTDQGFALAPDGYSGYPGRFPGDVDFTIGLDDPAQAWPYIHPGPDDAWAGSRAHRFTLNFTLAAAPATDLQLVVFLLDTHDIAPGSVDVALNGGTPATVALPAGGGIGYGAGSAFGSADRPAQFTVRLPAARLSAGKNVITIDKNRGSWMVYDAVGVYRV
jgi:hypothetical protein